jgi:hypothetical protein
MVKILVVSLPSALKSVSSQTSWGCFGETEGERKIWLNKQIALPLQPTSKKYSSSTSFLVGFAEAKSSENGRKIWTEFIKACTFAVRFETWVTGPE